MQTAIGGGAEQFAGMGTPLKGRAARFEEGLDIVRRLLAGETVTARYGDIDIRDAQRRAAHAGAARGVDRWQCGGRDRTCRAAG